ncbi:dephospho-CoA kinase [Gaetbulibacter saemankumensis]|uniref:dephospho-CoA kinase n=1 Tax=Gaetbulibacter saemankumensis TaxID=311208 RepID=UPI00040DDB39|nr:dephospho-CoA kinase [Gaetbulibacter saemankumensis]
MILVGLTGGIGSGKTTAAKEFENLGVPVYIADVEAKKLMATSESIKEKLIDLFGPNAYTESGLNRPFIADVIFHDKAYLEKMNAVVHPEVAKHFTQWVEKQKAPYVIKEVAILFETGGYKACDFVITVTAPKHLRVERLLKRDDSNPEKIEAIMNNQWQDEERIALSDFVIENVDLATMKENIKKIHFKIIDAIK